MKAKVEKEMIADDINTLKKAKQPDIKELRDIARKYAHKRNQITKYEATRKRFDDFQLKLTDTSTSLTMSDAFYSLTKALSQATPLQNIKMIEQIAKKFEEQEFLLDAQLDIIDEKSSFISLFLSYY